MPVIIAKPFRFDLMPLDYDATINAIGSIHSWHRFDESSGTSAADSSGNGYTGTHDSSSGTGDTEKVVNRSTYSKFYQTAQRTALSTSHSNDLGGGNRLSISSWARFVSFGQTNNTGRVIIRNDSVYRLYDYKQTVGGSFDGIYFFINGVNTDLNDSPYIDRIGQPLNTDTWYHVACTWNGTTGDQKIYLDGNLIDTETGKTGTLVTSATTTHIAADTPGTNYNMKGYLQEIVVFEKELLGSEVSDIYNAATA